MPKACPYVLIRKFSPRASQFQIIDNQYSIKIVGGREVSKALKKSAGGAILPFFLLITYGHSQLSIIGGVRFFVAGGVRAFGGEALVQVADFVVVLLKKKVDYLCNSFAFSNLEV